MEPNVDIECEVSLIQGMEFERASWEFRVYRI